MSNRKRPISLVVAMSFLHVTMSFLHEAQAQTCDPENLVVPADQNIEFSFVFHGDFSDQITVNRGARTPNIARSYRVGGMESAFRVIEQVPLPSEFDLSQDDRAVLSSLRIVELARGGTNPQDHTPVFLGIDRDNRTVTVSVDLENKRFDSRRVDWVFQIEQVRPVTEQVEPYPVNALDVNIRRALNAMSGEFDNRPISFNRMNASRYLSVLHVGSQCVIRTYEWMGNAYQQVPDMDRAVVINTGQEQAMVTVNLVPQDTTANPLQGVLVPELAEAP